MEPPRTTACGAFATVIMRSRCPTSRSTMRPAHEGNTCAKPMMDGCERCALGNESSTHRSKSRESLLTISVLAAASGENS